MPVPEPEPAAPRTVPHVFGRLWFVAPLTESFWNRIACLYRAVGRLRDLISCGPPGFRRPERPEA